jgi:hypothetical protein
MNLDICPWVVDQESISPAKQTGEGVRTESPLFMRSTFGWLSKTRLCVSCAVPLLVLLALVPRVARAQSALDGFDPGANGAVRALAVQADGKILVGGDLTTLGGGGIGTITRICVGRF